MELPKDPVMLLSVVNMYLRDRYPSLEEFCQSNGVSQKDLILSLASIDYHYDPEKNRFL